MTPQEAIKFLNETRAGCAFTSDRQLIDVCNMAISALEKQIPKKPLEYDRQEIRYLRTYDCPTCREGFTGTGFADYCYHCGQALDWGDEK